MTLTHCLQDLDILLLPLQWLNFSGLGMIIVGELIRKTAMVRILR